MNGVFERARDRNQHSASNFHLPILKYTLNYKYAFDR